MRKIGVGTYSPTPRTYELVTQVLDTTRVSYGPLCRELESKFSSIHESKFGVLSNSGTSSLQIALQSLAEIYNWPPHSRVVIPSVTFVATANIILHNHMQPLLVDVEPDTYGMSLDLLAKRLERDKDREIVAVIPVSLFGMPCDLKGITELCKSHNVMVIHDSCETMFARHHGKYNWGDITCYSMYVAHLLTAGVGGIATTDNPDYAAKMRSLVNHGRDNSYLTIDDDNDVGEEELKEIITKRFQFESVGHSSRITELEAALALPQLDTWEDMVIRRQCNALVLTATLSDLRHYIQLPTIRPDTSHSFMMYPIILRDESKWELCNYLESHGIETREMLRLTDQPCYQRMWEVKNYPVATWINRGGFYVGCHQGLDDDDMHYIAECIHTWANGEHSL